MSNNIFTKLMVVLTVVFLSACNEAVTVGDGYGSVGFSLDWDSSLVTKADSDAVEVADDTQITVSICDMDGNTVEGPMTYAYGALKEARFEVPVGKYNVKASTGANQQAAWDSPFYYGESEVTVYAARDNQAEVVCTLANVMVTVSFDERFAQYCTSYGVTVENGTGAGLTFSNENGRLDSEGYFSVTGVLSWKLILINNDGKSYIANGVIKDVRAQQHYPLSFTLSEIVEDETGNSVFKVTVDDSITEKEFDAVLDLSESGSSDMVTNGFDYVAGSIAVPMGDANEKTITTSMDNGIASAFVKVEGAWYELTNALQNTIDRLAALGVKATSVTYGARSFTVDVTDYLASIGEFGMYPVTVSAYDVKGLKTETVFDFEIISNVDASAVSVVPSAYSAVVTAKWYANERPEGLGLEYKAVDGAEWIQVPASAISYDEAQKRFSAEITELSAGTQYSFRPYSVKDREEIKTIEFYTDFTAPVSAQPWAKFAVVTGKWLTDVRPEGLAFKYREYGTTGWVDADPSKLRLDVDESAKTFVGDLTGLKPQTTYEFRAVSSTDAETNMNIFEFTTGKASTIYNMSFDDWYSPDPTASKAIWYPFDGAKESVGKHTWDSANEGAATFIGSSTTPTDDAVSGKAARMESKYAILAFAAGNLYTGDFGGVNGVGATLSWGVGFDSNPVALRGYYKYAPVKINRVEDNPYGVKKDDPDKCQIQVFLAERDSPFTINTTEKEFVEFDGKDKDDIIAFGRLEDADSYSSYKEFIIPLEYRDLSRTPKYVVISAAASYLGDYFTGGEGSTLYVDEFEFVYDISELTDEQASKVNYR